MAANGFEERYSELVGSAATGGSRPSRCPSGDVQYERGPDDPPPVFDAALAYEMTNFYMHMAATNERGRSML
jgi:hypothetical protein